VIDHQSDQFIQLPLRQGHFIDGELGAFDAPFFSVSAAEAVGMDPQARGLLETTYRALENGMCKIFKTSRWRH
jgi:acyl transferase domain-containing protein